MMFGYQLLSTSWSRYTGTWDTTRKHIGINRRVILQHCTMLVLIAMTIHMTSAPSNVILGMYAYFAERDCWMLYVLFI